MRHRRWLDEPRFADLVALCQFLPGPASSQVGMAIGIHRAGLAGSVVTWLGFTLPSAAALTGFAYGVAWTGAAGGWLHGLKIAAVAVVAWAVWGMARTLAPDRPRATLVLVAAAVALFWHGALAQVVIIAAAAVVGRLWLRGTAPDPAAPAGRTPVPRTLGLVALASFFALLIGLPLARRAAAGQALAVFDSFYRAGALVFGGGHVVLPLLQAEVVRPGWVTAEQFVAGYGAAQAVPGPLFTFAAYLGAAMATPPNGIAGAAWALVAVFLPGFLLLVGVLPFWDALRTRPDAQAALRGVNAAVVGLLLAALYQPVWTSAIGSTGDLALALVVFALLAFWSAPAWLVVVLSALGGAALGTR